jgi:hypothetical protein
MKTHPLVENEIEGIALSLIQQVGSCQDNIALVDSIQFELNHHDSMVHPPISTVNKNNSPIISISFHEINYYVDEKPRRRIFPCCKPKPRKQILHNISGGFSTGMNAILGKCLTPFFVNLMNIFSGPSGCGKSSLLDILADRKDTKGLTGRVLVSGKPRSKNFKYSIGYVVQEGKENISSMYIFPFVF